MKLILLFIHLLYFATLSGQSDRPDYYDGRIFVLFKSDCHLNIKQVPVNSRALDLSTYDKIVQGLFVKYQVTEIQDYFKHLNDQRFNHLYEIYFDKGASTDDFIDELELNPCVVYAERVPVMYQDYIPTDPLIFNQYTLNITEAFAAWDIHRDPSREVVIAIVDDAVRIDHEDLSPNLWINTGEIPNNGIDDDGNGYIDDVYGFDVAHNRHDPNPPVMNNFFFSHGTHCAGIASAASDNDLGVASLGFNCKIMSVKGKRDENTSNTIDNTTAGIVYAIVNRADVISMSFGSGGGGNTIQNLFLLANERGTLSFSSAGNDNTDFEFYPAAYKYVYSVASTNALDQKSGFSNYGDWIDISAPGSQILSTVAGSTNAYVPYSGTSMSCPNVAGLAGYLFGYHPNVTSTDVLDCMFSTADPLDELNPEYVGKLGHGRINARSAIECLANKPPTPRADFTRVNYAGVPVRFTDKSLNGNYSKWSFEGERISEEASFEFAFDTPGKYRLVLEIEEGYSLEEEIHILPSLPLPYVPEQAGYEGDFESDAGHFAAWNLQGSPWINGNSDESLKNGTYSGENAWVIAPDQPFYEPETRSYLYTPLFDFSEIAIYELSFYGKWDLNTGLDGFHVEYSNDGGRSWFKLGTFRKDWYNYKNTILGIAAYQIGESYFTLRQSNFKKFRWNVSELAGQSEVAFRFVFRSQDRGLAAGLVIDDFEIRRFDDEPLTVLRSIEGEFTNDNTIRINWTTRPEYFCKGFRVESSINARDWVEEAYVPAQGFELESLNYSYTTPNTRPRPLNFFRIRVENEGEAFNYEYNFYSEIVVVRKNISGLRLFLYNPNPFTDFIDLVFTDKLTVPLQYAFIDMSGRTLLKGEHPSGNPYYRIETGQLSSGVYLIHLIYGANPGENRAITVIKHK